MSETNNAGNVYAAGRGNILFLLTGWTSAVVSLFTLPFIFGVLGVIMGILSTREGSRAGLILTLGSIVLMTAGLLSNGLLFNGLRHFVGL